MASCDINALLASNPCLLGLTAAQVRTMLFSLLCNLSQTSAVVDVNSLIAANPCFSEQAEKTQNAIIVALLGQLLSTLVLQGQIISGNGPPNGVVPANEPALYYDKLTQIIYEKTGSGNTGWN